MKLLFWTLVIGGAMYWFLRDKLGGGNDLTAHFAEQKDLVRIGDVSNTANQSSTADYPISYLGVLPLTGLFLDPVNNANPFTAPYNEIGQMETPAIQHPNDWSYQG